MRVDFEWTLGFLLDTLDAQSYRIYMAGKIVW